MTLKKENITSMELCKVAQHRCRCNFVPPSFRIGNPDLKETGAFSDRGFIGVDISRFCPRDSGDM